MRGERKISKNIVYLGTVQGANYIVPLLIIPILLNRIGLDNYGMVALAQGIMNIFIAFVDFGFNITGTRLISQSQNVRERSLIVSKIYCAKLVLIIVGFLILVVSTSFIPQWKENSILIITSYGIVVGQGLFPTWYFLGIEKTGLLALLNLLSRILYLIGILLLVHSVDQVLLVNISSGVAWISVSTIGIIIIYRDLGYTSVRGGFGVLSTIQFARSNFSIFLSNFLNTGFRTSGIILAGFFLNTVGLGIYSILDKVLMLIVNAYIVVFSGVFPQVCSLAKRGKKEVIQFFRIFIPRISILVIFGIAVLLIFGAPILQYLSPEMASFRIEKMVYVIALFAGLMLLNLPITLTLTSFDLKKGYFIYNLTAILAMIILGSFLGKFYGIFGLLFSAALTELIIFCAGIVIINSLKFNFSRT
ncbi:MAG: oligosaccharide flippase family protein [Reichenbachiella sp.]